MKSTKIMLAVVASLIVSYMSIGFIFYILSDMTYKESLSNPGIILVMLFIGWIPALIVGADLEKEL